MQKLFKLILLIGAISSYKEYTYVSREINIFKKVEIKEKILATYSGPITAYGPDCKGCTGITASGYDVRNNIYYSDKEYGKIRIVAADKSIPFGTIIRIRKIFKEPLIAIVLDRGSAIGFNKRVYIDLLYISEKETLAFGKKTATFEVLRYGF